MISFIALPAVLAVGVAFVLVRGNGRGRNPWHALSGLGPVSGEWLADYRRIG